VTLKSFLDYGSQRDPCLALRCQTIPFLERPDVLTSGEEETDGICDKLPVRVKIAAQESHLSAFFDAREKDFGGSGGQVGAAKHSVNYLKHGRSRLTVDCAELIRNINHTHAGVPTLNGGVV
jgi:hypothetical protein